MSDKHDAAHGHGNIIKAYLVVFGMLCVFTAVSFIANFAVRHEMMTAETAMAIIMVVAVCKATLVGMYFMHLKFEWSKLYFIIVPVAILCVMMMIVLLPDIVIEWHLTDSAASTAKEGR